MQITINNTTKVYQNKKVLDIKHLQIEKGTCLGIIGSNGAGKSTLVNLVAGIDQATQGNILYDNEKLTKAKTKDITVVMQKPYLFRTTVFNNIAYALKIRKKERSFIEKEVNDLLEKMGLMHLKDRKAYTLSGGETQKVALARAIIFKPKLLLLDEPTANIDSSSMQAIESIIRQFHEEQQGTVIMVTHNIHQAKRICTKVLFMHDGKGIEQGYSDQVINNPMHSITRRFMRGEV